MIISIKKICKLRLYFTLFYFLLYDNIVIAENITESFNKIKKEEQLDTIPNLKLLNLYNQKVTISKLNESNNLIINFWATWCAPCIKEMPDLIELSNILRKSDYEIIYINQDRSNDIDKIQHYVDKIKLNKNNVFLDPKMKLSKIFKLRGIPTTFIINKSEKVLWRVEGIINWRDERIINWLKKI